MTKLGHSLMIPDGWTTCIDSVLVLAWFKTMMNRWCGCRRRSPWGCQATAATVRKIVRSQLTAGHPNWVNAEGRSSDLCDISLCIVYPVPSKALLTTTTSTDPVVDFECIPSAGTLPRIAVPWECLSAVCVVCTSRAPQWSRGIDQQSQARTNAPVSLATRCPP